MQMPLSWLVVVVDQLVILDTGGAGGGTEGAAGSNGGRAGLGGTQSGGAGGEWWKDLLVDIGSAVTALGGNGVNAGAGGGGYYGGGGGNPSRNYF